MYLRLDFLNVLSVYASSYLVARDDGLHELGIERKRLDFWDTLASYIYDCQQIFKDWQGMVSSGFQILSIWPMPRQISMHLHYTSIYAPIQVLTPGGQCSRGVPPIGHEGYATMSIIWISDNPKGSDGGTWDSCRKVKNTFSRSLHFISRDRRPRLRQHDLWMNQRSGDAGPGVAMESPICLDSHGRFAPTWPQHKVGWARSPTLWHTDWSPNLRFSLDCTRLFLEPWHWTVHETLNSPPDSLTKPRNLGWHPRSSEKVAGQIDVKNQQQRQEQGQIISWNGWCELEIYPRMSLPRGRLLNYWVYLLDLLDLVDHVNILMYKTWSTRDLPVRAVKLMGGYPIA